VTNGVRCRFQCKISGTLCTDRRGPAVGAAGVSRGGDVPPVPTVRHELYVGPQSHNHAPSDEVMRNAVPVEAMEDAVRLRNISHISCRDIVRAIEDKYEISVHRNRFCRRIASANARLHPADSDCNELISSLICMKQDNSQTFFNMRLTEDGRVHSVMWILPQ